MNDKDIDTIIRNALENEQELPQGLSERLEQYIDQLALKEKKKKTVPGRKSSLYWLSGIAASLILGVGLFLQIEKTHVVPEMKDTFHDPYEAAIAAQNALAFLSTQLNKGLEPVAEAQKDVYKVNKIINEQLELSDIQKIHHIIF